MKKKIIGVAISFLLFLTFGTVSASTISEITTTFSSNNGSSGNMFNVTNISAENVTLTGIFAGNFSDLTTGTVEIWYRIGGYETYETDASAWTFLGGDTYNSVGLDSETWFDVGSSLTVSSGQQIGVYMYDSGSNTEYTNGSLTYSDSYLSIVGGTGGPTEKFSGSIFSPRTWNGTIEYEYGVAAVPEPATVFLFGIGLLGLAGVSRRKK